MFKFIVKKLKKMTKKPNYLTLSKGRSVASVG